MSQGIHDQLLDEYRTHTWGRWALIGLLIWLFYIYSTGKRHRDADRKPAEYAQRLFSVSLFPGGPQMFHSMSTTEMPATFSSGEARRTYRFETSAEVTVLPGAQEPDNLESRVHFAGVFDFSGSMSRHATKLPGAWQRMVEVLAKQPVTRLRMELACCVFDDRIVLQDYAPLPFYLESSLEFSGGGSTALAGALRTVITRTLGRREELAAQGVSCHRSVCAVITDGEATDQEAMPAVIEAIRRCEASRQIDFVPIAPDRGCVELLEEIFAKEPVLLDEMDYDHVFSAFTRSLSTYSQSMVGMEPDATGLVRSELQQGSQSLFPGSDVPGGQRLLGE